MGRIILGVLLLIGLFYNGYILYKAVTYPDQFGRMTETFALVIYTKATMQAALIVADLLMMMVFIMIINFMDMGWKERKRKKAQKRSG